MNVSLSLRADLGFAQRDEEFEEKEIPAVEFRSKEEVEGRFDGEPSGGIQVEGELRVSLHPGPLGKELDPRDPDLPLARLGGEEEGSLVETEGGKGNGERRVGWLVFNRRDRSGGFVGQKDRAQPGEGVVRGDPHPRTLEPNLLEPGLAPEQGERGMAKAERAQGGSRLAPRIHEEDGRGQEGARGFEAKSPEEKSPLKYAREDALDQAGETLSTPR